MSDNIVRTPFDNLTELKKVLKANGIPRFFEKSNNTIIIQESDTVQVKISLIQNYPIVKTVFPQIGNTVQVIMSVVFIALFVFLKIPYSVILGILAGQVASFGWHYPKINQLKRQVIEAIQN